MSAATHIALRYMRSRRSHFVSLITVIAILGITVGVAALNITLAVVNGFRDQVQLKFVENMPMVTVINTDPRSRNELEGTVERVLQVDDVVAASPFIRKEAVVTLERMAGSPRHRAAVVWGIDPTRQDDVTPLSRNIEPAFQDFAPPANALHGDIPGIVLGSELAYGLRAGLGDRVTLTVPRGSGSLGEYEGVSSEYQVVGVLSSGMYEFDRAFVYIDLTAAQSLFEMPAAATGIGVRVADMMRAPEVADRIQEELGAPPFFCNDWINMNSELFKWINMEKVLMFALLLLITVVACFMVVAILTMMVRDRQRDIGILMAMGMNRSGLVGIFVQLGLVMGLIGIALGSALGFGVSYLVDKFGVKIPGGVYFVDTLPVHMKQGDFALVAAVTLGMAFLATLLPSWLASRFAPVEVLRYE